jgi:mono/diheme cytochrome c family protein
VRRIAGAIVAVLIVGTIAAWWVTRPGLVAAPVLPDHEPNAAAGEQVFWAGGCASCHATPVNGERAEGNFKLVLGGGVELDTPYGIFRVPNISPHESDGIGAWSMLEFVSAMQRGVAPDGRPYYPSFPYTSYAKMAVEDVMDLKAYLDTLRAVPGRVADHSLSFPWSIRRGINGWQQRYLNSAPVSELESMTTEVARGRALVEGAGHCGECHTPRDWFGGLDTKRWLGGAPNPEGRGQIPDITRSGKNTAEWSASDIRYYLESGFTPDFDTVGGSMVVVQENLAMLPKSDLEAIAAYLKAIPAARD